MHNIYKSISYFLIPFIYLNTLIRLIKKKEDHNRYKERFGFTNLKKNSGKEVIWIHASSVGEFKSCDLLINHFYKTYNLLITTTTKTAADYAIENYGEKIIHQYAPYDVLPWIDRFLNVWKPKFVVWIESDIWPNTIVRLREKKISAIFLNARISPKSFEKWKFFSSYYKFITNTFFEIYAQSKNDLERITKLTDINVGYLGNLKLTKKNTSPSKYEISEKINIMIASTHQNEENLIIPYLQNISEKYPLINFIIAPRHPSRAKTIYNLLKNKKLDVEYHSKLENGDCRYLIIDSFGKMEEFFTKSDIVFLGGSLTKKGGHNPIEAALANCAIISGPYVFNWQNLYEEMINQNSCLMINEAKELEIKIINLIENKSLIEKYKKNALTFSNTVFFKENKLLKLLDNKLRYNA
ncbi:MAG: 3-deoxy-D-manno-octulosonic acid transferase [Alphaproteobacteria bacterium]